MQIWLSHSFVNVNKLFIISACNIRKMCLAISCDIESYTYINDNSSRSQKNSLFVFTRFKLWGFFYTEISLVRCLVILVVFECFEERWCSDNIVNHIRIAEGKSGREEVLIYYNKITENFEYLRRVYSQRFSDETFVFPFIQQL